MNAPEKLPSTPRIQDLSFVRLTPGRGINCYFHVGSTGDHDRDFELGVNKAVEYLDFLKAGGHFPLQFIILDVVNAMQDRATRGAASGFLRILGGCLSGCVNSLQYREWSEQVIQADRDMRARIDAFDAERKSDSRKRAWATRKANLARKRSATAAGSEVAGGAA